MRSSPGLTIASRLCLLVPTVLSSSSEHLFQALGLEVERNRAVLPLSFVVFLTDIFCLGLETLLLSGFWKLKSERHNYCCLVTSVSQNSGTAGFSWRGGIKNRRIS
jgi:hypothetical protein